MYIILYYIILYTVYYYAVYIIQRHAIGLHSYCNYSVHDLLLICERIWEQINDTCILVSFCKHARVAEIVDQFGDMMTSDDDRTNILWTSHRHPRRRHRHHRHHRHVPKVKTRKAWSSEVRLHSADEAWQCWWRWRWWHRWRRRKKRHFHSSYLFIQ